MLHKYHICAHMRANLLDNGALWDIPPRNVEFVRWDNWSHILPTYGAIMGKAALVKRRNQYNTITWIQRERL